MREMILFLFNKKKRHINVNNFLTSSYLWRAAVYKYAGVLILLWVSGPVKECVSGVGGLLQDTRTAKEGRREPYRTARDP